jgi:hypothetical protein
MNDVCCAATHVPVDICSLRAMSAACGVDKSAGRPTANRPATRPTFMSIATHVQTFLSEISVRRLPMCLAFKLRHVSGPYSMKWHNRADVELEPPDVLVGLTGLIGRS